MKKVGWTQHMYYMSIYNWGLGPRPIQQYVFLFYKEIRKFNIAKKKKKIDEKLMVYFFFKYYVQQCCISDTVIHMFKIDLIKST